MLSGETPACAATAAIVVSRKPSRSNSSRAACTTSRRRASARARRPEASYVLLTCVIFGPHTLSTVKLYLIGVIVTSYVSADPAALVVRSIHAMADGGRDGFEPLYHPRAVDRENRIQPASSRGPGAAGFYSTALWLRAAFADLHYDIHHAVADGDLVVVNSTM